jgi:hypothetical protein
MMPVLVEQPRSHTKVRQKILASVEICRNLITASLLQPNSEAQGSPREEAVEIGNS